MTNLFELASRKAFRFPSSQGMLTLEQLWSLPLRTTTAKADLNSVAVAISIELKGFVEENFVSIKPTPGRADVEAKLEIVKHIIAVRQEENAKTLRASVKAEERRKILDALDRKNDEELTTASKEDLLARLAALDD